MSDLQVSLHVSSISGRGGLGYCLVFLRLWVNDVTDDIVEYMISTDQRRAPLNSFDQLALQQITGLQVYHVIACITIHEAGVRVAPYILNACKHAYFY